MVEVRISFFFVELDLRFGNVAHFKNGLSSNMSPDASSIPFILSPTAVTDDDMEDEEGGGKSGKTGCELDS